MMRNEQNAQKIIPSEQDFVKHHHFNNLEYPL